MNKPKVQYIVDVGLVVSFLGVFVSGVFKFYPLRNYFTKVFEIIPTELMRTIHDYSGIAMGILVIIHLALNWKWMIMETKNFFGGEKVGK